MKCEIVCRIIQITIMGKIDLVLIDKKAIYLKNP
jgi:hypothetical protein